MTCEMRPTSPATVTLSHPGTSIPSSCSLLGIVKRRGRAHRGFSFPCQTLLLLLLLVVAQRGLQLSEPHTFTSSCQPGSQQCLGEAEVSPGKVSEGTCQGSKERPLLLLLCEPGSLWG